MKRNQETSKKQDIKNSDLSNSKVSPFNVTKETAKRAKVNPDSRNLSDLPTGKSVVSGAIEPLTKALEQNPNLSQDQTNLKEMKEHLQDYEQNMPNSSELASMEIDNKLDESDSGPITNELDKMLASNKNTAKWAAIFDDSETALKFDPESRGGNSTGLTGKIDSLILESSNAKPDLTHSKAMEIDANLDKAASDITLEQIDKLKKDMEAKGVDINKKAAEVQTQARMYFNSQEADWSKISKPAELYDRVDAAKKEQEKIKKNIETLEIKRVHETISKHIKEQDEIIQDLNETFKDLGGAVLEPNVSKPENFEKSTKVEEVSPDDPIAYVERMLSSRTLTGLLNRRDKMFKSRLQSQVETLKDFCSRAKKDSSDKQTQAEIAVMYNGLVKTIDPEAKLLKPIEILSQEEDLSSPTLEQLKVEYIPDIHTKLSKELEKASALSNANETLKKHIEDAKKLIDNHENTWQDLTAKEQELEKNYECRAIKCDKEFKRQIDNLDQLGLNEDEYEMRYDEFNNAYENDIGEIEDEKEQNIQTLYANYYKELKEHFEALQSANPEYRPKTNQRKDTTSKINQLDTFFSEDETQSNFAIEASLTLGYLGHWQRKGVQVPDTPEFKESYNSALQIVYSKDKDITPVRLNDLKKINATFEKAIQEAPDQFRQDLRDAQTNARHFNDWATKFQKWFKFTESWVKGGMEQLGITADNFYKSLESLGPISGEILLNPEGLKRPRSIEDIVADYQDDEIVPTYQIVMRAKAKLEYVKSQLNEGVPVKGIPERIWDRVVKNVRTNNFDCLPRSLMTGAHPEWPEWFREEQVTKATKHVIEELTKLKNQLPTKINEFKGNLGVSDTEAKERALEALEIFDEEELNLNLRSMLDAGSMSGRILLYYLRTTKVTDPITGEKEVPLLDPSRPVDIYQYNYHNKKMQFFNLYEPIESESSDPPYIVLREHSSAPHYRAVLPPGVESKDINRATSKDGSAKDTQTASSTQTMIDQGDNEDVSAVIEKSTNQFLDFFTDNISGGDGGFGSGNNNNFGSG